MISQPGDFLSIGENLLNASDFRNPAHWNVQGKQFYPEELISIADNIPFPQIDSITVPMEPMTKDPLNPLFYIPKNSYFDYTNRGIIGPHDISVLDFNPGN
ncbi:MAG: hypothetical protein ABFS17_07910 [Chloroflexota bacterium]